MPAPNLAPLFSFPVTSSPTTKLTTPSHSKPPSMPTVAPSIYRTEITSLANPSASRRTAASRVSVRLSCKRINHSSYAATVTTNPPTSSSKVSPSKKNGSANPSSKPSSLKMPATFVSLASISQASTQYRSSICKTAVSSPSPIATFTIASTTSSNGLVLAATLSTSWASVLCVALSVKSLATESKTLNPHPSHLLPSLAKPTASVLCFATIWW